jgi:hypothetical protein
MASLGLAAGVAFAGTAQAQTVVTDDITTSTTWTKANAPYDLQGRIIVREGASLTIEKGVVIASTFDSNDNSGGSLIVSRGSKIFVQGTEDQPVIMTSGNDVRTWDNSVVSENGAGNVSSVSDIGDAPYTSGEWRPAANEWGSLAILGEGIISASEFDVGGDGTVEQVGPATDGSAENPDKPLGTAQKQMEGTTVPGGPEGDADDVRYGGANDNDSSGVIKYLSLRYGGDVLGEGNELNGMSMGGVGRGTDVHHVEVMNNVDDGIETWGGTVNYKYCTVWNIGDDSFDFDEGWRGKGQFLFVVQGYSLDADKGSGVADNAFETDGAEQSNAQPVTTGVFNNVTVIGQPLNQGDRGATTWRDGTRLQYNNSVFIDTGVLVQLDNKDGDGGQGYGYDEDTSGGVGDADVGPTLTWTEVWDKPYTYSTTAGDASTAFEAPFSMDQSEVPTGQEFNHPDQLYQAQNSGNLAQIHDSVFWGVSQIYDAKGNTGAGFSAPDVMAASNFNKNYPSRPSDQRPIVSLTRGETVENLGPNDDFDIQPVDTIDPRAANDATDSQTAVPADGFFTPVDYRGAFSASSNWALGWSASDAYGFYSSPDNPAPAEAEDVSLPVSIVSFSTESGVLYTVECSDDGENWEPVAVVEGDGTTKQVSNVLGDDFEGTQIYRVRVQ